MLYFLCAILSACFIFFVPYYILVLYYACVLCSCVMSAPLLLLLYGFSIRLCSHAYLCFFRACLFMCLDWIPLYIPYMQNFDVFSPLLPSHDKSIVCNFTPRHFTEILLFLSIRDFHGICFLLHLFYIYFLFFIFCDFFLFVMGVKSAILYVVNRRFSHILLRIYTRKISLNIFHFDSLEMKGKDAISEFPPQMSLIASFSLSFFIC